MIAHTTCCITMYCDVSIIGSTKRVRNGLHLLVLTCVMPHSMAVCTVRPTIDGVSTVQALLLATITKPSKPPSRRVEMSGDLLYTRSCLYTFSRRHDRC